MEVEIVSLQPIGPGVQTLESGMPGAGTMQRTPAITYPSQGFAPFFTIYFLILVWNEICDICLYVSGLGII